MCLNCVKTPFNMQYEFESFWNKYKALIDNRINFYFEGCEHNTLLEAMRYSLQAGGKRFRPILTFSSAFALRIEPERCIDYSLALELIHTYSLIHDDLPGMDNSDLRRGKPTSHKQFGEGVAILAGDALQTEAFNILANMDFSGEAIKEAIKLVSFNSGLHGMCGGQLLDLELLKNPLNEDTLKKVSSMKTGALIKASILGPAVLFEARDEEIYALDSYANNVGLIFQMMDDILDVTGNASITGKNAGVDVTNGKHTYTSVMGIEKTRHQINELYNQALKHISIFGDRSKYLNEMAKHLATRDR